MRRPVAVTDQLGRTTLLRRDPAGRVVRRESPTGGVIEWRRDPRGLATDVRVNGRDAFVFDHDAAGRPVLVHEPGPSRTPTLGWTPGGRLAALDVDGATLGGSATATAWSSLAATRRVGAPPTAATGPVACVTVTSDRWGTVDARPRPRRAARRPEGRRGRTRWDRDAAGLVVSYRRAAGPAAERSTELRRDAGGRVVEARTAAGVSRYALRRRRPAGVRLTPAGAWTWGYDAGGPAGRRVRAPTAAPPTSTTTATSSCG